MDGDELGAIWKCRFHLHVMDHLGDALHDLVAGEDFGTCGHQVGDALGHRVRLRQRKSEISATASG